MRKILKLGELQLAVRLVLGVLFVGTVGYIVIEDYGWIDAFYMSVITVSTVGFGEVQALSWVGKLFTSCLIIFSIGTYAYAISAFTRYFGDYELLKKIKQKRVQKEIARLKNHVVVCGYGRNGKQASKTLAMHKKDFVVIESNQDLISVIKEDGFQHTLEGDATSDITLKSANLENASALITALPSDALNLFVVLSARQMNKNLTIIARASSSQSVRKLRIAGADNVIMPDKLGGSHMATLVVTPDVVEFIEHISIGSDNNINLEEITFSEIPENYQYKTFREMNIRYQTGCTVIGFKTANGEYVINPSADTAVIPDSKFFVLGTPDQITKLNEVFLLEKA
jgi:voltage-gated potassium channel